MTISTHGWADGELRIPVIDARVECPRVGMGDLDRCRECAYLVRLDDAVLAGASEIHIVCSATAAGAALENGGEGWWTE